MSDGAGVEEKESVGVAGVDMERAGLVRVAEHLHDAGKVVMGEAAAETGVGLRKHLRGLKAFGFADDDVANVRGDGGGWASAVNVIVATSLERFHEGALAAIAESDDRKRSVFRVGANQAGDIESAHFAHVGGANDSGGRIVLDGGERERRLSAADDLEAFFFQSVADTLGKVDVGIDEQNLGGASG